MGKSRNWDDSPESDRDRKFHNARAANPDAALDQDGNVVTSGRDFEILQDLAARNARSAGRN